jgi:basic amino acid/polyamine antiporter, APA family
MSDATSLRRVIGPGGYFTLSFGSIVGSGWVMVLGEWLNAAGPGGSALGFAAGGLVMMCVVACYGELAVRMPKAGGEFNYVLHSLGRPLAFAVGWFLTLGLLAFTAFEGIAFAWLVSALLPQAQGPVLYELFNHQVGIGDLILGIAGAALFATINYVGTSTAVALQRIVTFGFLGVIVVLIVAGFAFGAPSNLEPAFASLVHSSWTTGAAWILATTAIFLNGFQTALYAIEERRQDLSARQVVIPMIIGVATAVAFYVCIILSASFIVPWGTTAAAKLPAAFAFGQLTRSGVLATFILIVATGSLLKSWNAYVLGASRLMLAQAQHGMLPRALNRLHARFASPVVAIGFIFVFNVLGVLLGRGAIVPIVNMCAIVSACSFVLCLIVLLRERRSTRAVAFVVPGGAVFIALTLIATAAMAAFAFYEPLTRSAGGIPTEWLLMAGWAALGFVFWFTHGRRAVEREPQRRTTGKINRERSSGV